jgi:hypothetical protein
MAAAKSHCRRAVCELRHSHQLSTTIDSDAATKSATLFSGIPLATTQKKTLFDDNSGMIENK